jgi:predicted N-acyltransferase
MEVQIVSSLAGVSADLWNALRTDDFPFSRHEHLRILEDTGCLGARTGWMPQYLLGVDRAARGPGLAASQDPDSLYAATWLYQKTNSYGEFVFDHEWADLYDRLGLPYFPKAVTAIPFTPATGSKLLGPPSAWGPLAGELLQVAQRQGSSSVHMLFVPDVQRDVMQKAGWALRSGVQFHWRNRNYRDFCDFLDQLKKKRRKEIVYERRHIDHDLEICCLQGSDLTSEYADFAFELYHKTHVEKMSFVCLTREYFQEVFSAMRPHVRFFVARRTSDHRPVAGALFFCDGKAMFGRYWGSTEERKYLHFELCYYAPIEHAIKNQWLLVEAGAQGSHKISRGFLPSLTLSAHYFFIDKIHAAFVKFCDAERQGLLRAIQEYQPHLPYQEGNDTLVAGATAGFT